MKDEFPEKPNKNECGIFNLQNSNQNGSHWLAYGKKGNVVYYFDSYGNAKPPKEFIKYMKGCNIFYDDDRYQDFDDPPFCGHACLFFLKNDYNFIPDKWTRFLRNIVKTLYIVNQKDSFLSH